MVLKMQITSFILSSANVMPLSLPSFSITYTMTNKNLNKPINKVWVGVYIDVESVPVNIWSQGWNADLTEDGDFKDRTYTDI